MFSHFWSFDLFYLLLFILLIFFIIIFIPIVHFVLTFSLIFAHSPHNLLFFVDIELKSVHPYPMELSSSSLQVLNWVESRWNVPAELQIQTFGSCSSLLCVLLFMHLLFYSYVLCFFHFEDVGKLRFCSFSVYSVFFPLRLQLKIIQMLTLENNLYHIYFTRLWDFYLINKINTNVFTSNMFTPS